MIFVADYSYSDQLSFSMYLSSVLFGRSECFSNKSSRSYRSAVSSSTTSGLAYWIILVVGTITSSLSS